MNARIVLTITLENGKITVHGPVHDKGLSYMLLELARDAVKDYQAVPSSILPPFMSLPPKRVG